MPPLIKKITENSGLLKTSDNEVLGLWFHQVKDANLLSADKSEIIELLSNQQKENELVFDSHKEMVKYNAISLVINDYESTRNYGGVFLRFGALNDEKLIARKFPSIFPTPSVMTWTTYESVSSKATKLMDIVTEPRGIPTDKAINFMKVVCTKCHNILDEETTDAVIKRGLYQIIPSMKVDADFFCPKCKHTNVVVGCVNLSDKESKSLLTSLGYYSAEELRDNKLDFATEEDYRLIKKGMKVLTGKEKVKKFEMNDIKPEPNIQPKSNSGCLGAIVFITFVLLMLFSAL